MMSADLQHGVAQRSWITSRCIVAYFLASTIIGWIEDGLRRRLEDTPRHFPQGTFVATLDGVIVAEGTDGTGENEFKQGTFYTFGQCPRAPTAGPTAGPIAGPTAGPTVAVTTIQMMVRKQKRKVVVKTMTRKRRQERANHDGANDENILIIIRTTAAVLASNLRDDVMLFFGTNNVH
jgi:hypothetical protein